MKKKGFTLLELLICITMISVVVLFLFRLINSVRKDEQVVGYIKDNQVNRNELMRYLGKIFTENTICGYTIQDNSPERAAIRFNFCNGGTSGMTDYATIYVTAKDFYVSYDGSTVNYKMKDSSAYYNPKFLTSTGTFNRNTYTKITFKTEKKGLDSNSIDDIEIYWVQPQYVPSTVTYTYGTSNAAQTQNTLTIPETGVYLLEAWGAEGGYSTTKANGGTGAYVKAKTLLTKGDVLYINVGTHPTCTTADNPAGGYNGGGNACNYGNSSTYRSCPGGGATSIALKSGQLSSLTNDRNTVLIVAAGGGGATYIHNSSTDHAYINGGHGGGYLGGSSYANDGDVVGHDVVYARGGSQSYGGEAGYIDTSPSTARGTFGRGYQLPCNNNLKYAGGGAGWYGGGSSISAGGGGGSSYIGSSLLTDAAMYCIGCSSVTNSFTKTIALGDNDYSEVATAEKAKKAGGYARITLLDDAV